jgi:hypothetical protein
MTALRPGFALVALLVCVGCHYSVGGGVQGSGIAKTESRKLDAFDEIELAGTGRLEVTVGEPTPLTITGDDNIVPLIQTTVRGGRLTIQPSQSINATTDLVFRVVTADLKLLECSGAASAIVTGIDNESLKAIMNGAGSLKLSGQTGRFELSVAGAATANASDLAARDVVADISGASSADVHAIETLKATANGASSIRYTGDPKIEQSISGVGSVRKKN